MTDIRDATPADVDRIKHLAIVNEMFAPEEVTFFDEILAGFFDGSLEGHRWIVAVGDGNAAAVDDGREELAAAAYDAPEPFSDRMWNLYFIATDPDQQGSGAGTALIEQVESALRDAGPDVARTLIVDTSSMDGYEQARTFYERRGFVEEARIRDFYGPGDHKVTFWKSLVAS